MIQAILSAQQCMECALHAVPVLSPCLPCESTPIGSWPEGVKPFRASTLSRSALGEGGEGREGGREGGKGREGKGMEGKEGGSNHFCQRFDSTRDCNY